MEINEKIKIFFKEKGLDHTQIGAQYGVSQQTITNYLNKKREIPLSFIVWMKEEYPDIDVNSIFCQNDDYITLISAAMTNRKETKKAVLDKIGKILDELI